VNARYLLRLDDACETMDGARWEALENLLDRLAIKPIVAVVPENADPDLRRAPPDSGFWDRVRAWQARGWTIAMHGFQHRLHPTTAKLVLPFYPHSEFGGLPYEEQAQKIRSAWRVFSEQAVRPDVWIAPAHCFDRVTLQALRNETPIRVVSDGIARRQYYEEDFFWLPQQLWQFAEKSSGLWTVCLHPNSMLPAQLDTLAIALEHRYRERITSFDRLVLQQRGKSPADHLYAMYFWQRHRAQRLRQRIVASWRSV
jgi:predicted deacetylase